MSLDNFVVRFRVSKTCGTDIYKTSEFAHAADSPICVSKMARSMLYIVAFLVFVTATSGFSVGAVDGNPPRREYNDPVGEVFESMELPSKLPESEQQHNAKERRCWSAIPNMCSGTFGKRRVRSTV